MPGALPILRAYAILGMVAFAHAGVAHAVSPGMGYDDDRAKFVEGAPGEMSRQLAAQASRAIEMAAPVVDWLGAAIRKEVRGCEPVRVAGSGELRLDCSARGVDDPPELFVSVARTGGFVVGLRWSGDVETTSGKTVLREIARAVLDFQGLSDEAGKHLDRVMADAPLVSGEVSDGSSTQVTVSVRQEGATRHREMSILSPWGAVMSWVAPGRTGSRRHP